MPQSIGLWYFSGPTFQRMETRLLVLLSWGQGTIRRSSPTNDYDT
jgi:hypothetical protein